MEAFYVGVLQLPELKRWPGHDGERSVWLDLGGGAILALERMPGGAPGHAADWETDIAGLHVLALGITRDERADWEARLAARRRRGRAPHPVFALPARSRGQPHRPVTLARRGDFDSTRSRV